MSLRPSIQWHQPVRRIRSDQQLVSNLLVICYFTINCYMSAGGIHDPHGKYCYCHTCKLIWKSTANSCDLETFISASRYNCSGLLHFCIFLFLKLFVCPLYRVLKVLPVSPMCPRCQHVVSPWLGKWSLMSGISCIIWVKNSYCVVFLRTHNRFKIKMSVYIKNNILSCSEKGEEIFTKHIWKKM